MREILIPYSRLSVPWVHTRLSTGRLLVMDEVVGVPLREAPPGDGQRARPRDSCSRPSTGRC